MNYLLEKNELNSLILFNGLIGDRLQRKSITDQLKVWDEVIFNNLLIKQPELKKEYNFFLSCASCNIKLPRIALSAI